jgi:hypothetical protein
VLIVDRLHDCLLLELKRRGGDAALYDPRHRFGWTPTRCRYTISEQSCGTPFVPILSEREPDGVYRLE